MGFVSLPTTVGAKEPVLTRSYDNGRTGANIRETSLTPAAITSRGMKKAYSLTLPNDDPRIEAQPLYVPDVRMSNGNLHDVIYVFSMLNRVYAFDAANGAPLWPAPVSLGKPFVPDPSDPVDIHHINRAFGILSTPVIDRAAQILYAVNWIVDEQGDRQLKVNALALADGQPPAGKSQPLSIQASFTNATGQQIKLDQVQKQRAALLLAPLATAPAAGAHKMLYVATTGDDTPPSRPDARLGHHGWVVAFDVDDWKQSAAWLATPNSFGGGIWQSSQGPAADDDGNVYVMTSNGGYLVMPDGSAKDFVGSTDFPESFIKLSYTSGSLNLHDWFTAFRDSTRKNWTKPEVTPFSHGYNYADQDLGSGGPLLPPGTNLLMGADKDGVLYVLDRNNLGRTVGDVTKLKAPPTFLTFAPDQSVSAYHNASTTGNMDFKPSPGVQTHHLHGTPVFWISAAHGPMLFAWGENSELRAFAVKPSGQVVLRAHGAEIASAKLAADKSTMGGMPGGMPTLSANGGETGVVWATAPVDGDANMDVVAGVVRAYDAARYDPVPDGGIPRMRLLWQQAGFTYSKFCSPVVADGRLLVPTYDGRVDVYVLN